MPLLQRLQVTIDTYTRFEAQRVESVMIPIGDYPRLSSLSVSLYFPGLSVSFGESVASSLTSITIRIFDFSMLELSRLIAVCPALRSLSLGWWFSEQRSIAERPVIIFPPSTVELRVMGSTLIEDVAKFRGQNIQSLQNLHLISTSGVLPRIPDEAFPNLRKLRLWNYDSPRLSIPFLQLPSLEGLEVEVRSLEGLRSEELDTFIEACRNLQSLEIIGWISEFEAWQHAEGIVRHLLEQPTPNIVFGGYDSEPSWSADAVLLSQQFPDRVFFSPVRRTREWL
jgi:hypothetical protein